MSDDGADFASAQFKNAWTVPRACNALTNGVHKKQYGCRKDFNERSGKPRNFRSNWKGKMPVTPSERWRTTTIMALSGGMYLSAAISTAGS
jgi:hypothetical protein